MRPLLPLGTSDFASIREDKRYYVDKSMLVKDIVEGGSVTLITRPRRFGKTLGMSMLKYFYDNSRDNRHLFEGLAILQEKELCERYMGKHAVVFLSLKDIKGSTWEKSLYSLRRMISDQFGGMRFLLGSDKIDEDQRSRLKTFLSNTASEQDFSESIRFLCQLLYQHFGAKAVVLIDEYDTLIISAWLNGYYQESIEFMRPFFGSTFKDNEYLEKGILTGILRVAKESLFSGLNNFEVCSVLEKPLNDKFGFTEDEVIQMLAAFDFNGKQLQDIREWYNGYNYWGVTIYNPWSILSYIKSGIDIPMTYWVNTGDDPLLKSCMLTGPQNIREHMQLLIEGGKVHLPLNRYLVFSELDTDVNAVWNLLLFAGYLKVENIHVDDGILMGDISIPNIEVRTVYRTKIQSFLSDGIGNSQLTDMLKAMLAGNEKSFTFFFTGFIERIVSVYDVARPQTENFYHAFLLGLFVNLERDYIVKSNKESGEGRYDIALIPRHKGKPGVVFEIKTPSKIDKETIQHALENAKQQMELRRYETELEQHGASPIYRYAIAVKGKKTIVKIV